ncbi:MAG: CPBP family intramembrane metalloprotease [Anaerolineales bacterium]|nr:CPBP family intramembrane metalloprotease [Anaerolineales bacterium]
MKTLPSFLWLVLIFSAPLWLASSFFDATKIIPVKLPFSALQFLSVFAAAITTARQNGHSVRELLLRGVDIKRISQPFWRIGIFVLMPLTVALSYWMILWSGGDVPDKTTPLLSIPVFLLIYGVSGYCEQIGWTAMMTDTLLERYTVLKAGIIVGITWAVWHIIPFMQTHNPAIWIFWQCMYTIIYRVLLTKVYIRTERSVFATIAMHATYNTAFSLMPYYGSSYNPMFMTLATLCTTVLVFTLSSLAQRNKLAV